MRWKYGGSERIMWEWEWDNLKIIEYKSNIEWLKEFNRESEGKWDESMVGVRE